MRGRCTCGHDAWPSTAIHHSSTPRSAQRSWSLFPCSSWRGRSALASASVSGKTCRYTDSVPFVLARTPSLSRAPCDTRKRFDSARYQLGIRTMVTHAVSAPRASTLRGGASVALEAPPHVHGAESSASSPYATPGPSGLGAVLRATARGTARSCGGARRGGRPDRGDLDRDDLDAHHVARLCGLGTAPRSEEHTS